MTITDLTVGTATTGNNASVTAGTPSGIVDGDFVCIVAAIRNAGTGVPNTPSGWTKIADNGNLCAFGRFWQTGDVIPAVSFTGGVANADTYARAFKARGVAKDQLTEAPASTSTNGSQQNINYPSMDLLGPNFLLVMAAWKQDDAASIATPSGWTDRGLTNQTTGDDMLVQLYSQLQTTETDITSGALVVTGGTAQVGRSLILAIRPAPSVTVTEFDLFPPRTLVTVTDLTNDDDVEIYRVVAGERTLLRGGVLESATDPSFVVVDGELPFDVPVSYAVIVNSSGEYTTSGVTYALPGGKVVLSDAISGDASEFVVVSWPEKEYAPQSSIFKVGGRNVVVTGDLGMFESDMEIFFEAYSSTENFRALVEAATEGVLQLRRPLSTYEGVDCYLAIVSARERRYSQDGSDGRRTWALKVVETEAWSEDQVAQAFTLQDIADRYSGLTLADLADDYPTLLAVAQGDFSA